MVTETKSDKLENQLVSTIRKVMSNRKLEPIGACHYCNEYVRGTDLFCCEECAKDWEESERRNK